MSIFDQRDIDRFWSKVRIGKEDECWAWIASKFGNGYGQFYYKRKGYNAHVFTFMITNDIILNGTDVLIRHTCNNRICCNPFHLIEGNYSDNLKDAYNSGRKPINLSGINNPLSSLTKEEVIKIRQLSWHFSSLKISRMLEFKNKISNSGIKRILNGTSYKDIK